MKPGDMVQLRRIHYKNCETGTPDRIGIVVCLRDEHGGSPMIRVLWGGGKIDDWGFYWFRENYEVISETR